MTYDAILAARGWGPEAFDRVTAPFHAAVRHAVFADRMAPILESLERIRQTQADPLLPSTVRAAIGRARVDAARVIDQARPLLFPDDVEDPPGG